MKNKLETKVENCPALVILRCGIKKGYGQCDTREESYEDCETYKRYSKENNGLKNE